MPSRKCCRPCSEDEPRHAQIDERKRKRMISNRESARRSRMRIRQHIKDLKHEIMHLPSKGNEIVQKINEITRSHTIVESENTILRVQKEELSRRLEFLEMISNHKCMTNEYSKGSLQDSGINPLQPQFQYQPLMTSAGIF